MSTRRPPRARGPQPRRWRLIALVLSVVAASACGRQTGGMRAQRVDVQVQVHDDGSLSVREEIAVRLDPAARFRRVVDLFEADQLVFTAATANGARVNAVVDDRALFRSTRRLAVEWPASAQEALQTLTLEYRVLGAVQVTDRRGHLEWPALEYDRSYAVDASSLVLTVPATSHLFEHIGIAEAGWTVERRPDGIRATRDAVGLEGATLLADFSVDPVLAPIPNWQVTLDMREQFGPAFVAGGLFMLVVGGGIIWIIRFQHPPLRAVLDRAATSSSSELPPAMAAALVRGTLRSTIDQRSATVLALGAARHAGGGSHGGETIAGLPLQWEHERMVASVLTTAASQLAIARSLAKGAASFDAALVRDLQAAGLVDSERLTVAQGLRTSAWVIALLSIACSVVARVALSRFGWWPQAMPLSMLVVSGVLLWFGRRFRAWTPDGAAAAASWRAKIDVLRTVQPRTLEAITADLPLAAGVGLGPLWLRRYGAQLAPDLRQLAAVLIRSRGIPGLRPR